MITSLALLVSGYVMAAPPLFAPLPTDVSGAARGADAVGFDPAAAARVDGFELQVRQRGRAAGSGLGAWGIALTAPLVLRTTLFGGYVYNHLPRMQGGRGTVGLGAHLGAGLYTGLSLHAISPRSGAAATKSLDAGLLWEAASYLALSLGVDSLNAASGVGVHVPRTLRLGVAARPLRGQPWLTLAADTRLSGGYRAAWQVWDTRAHADISAFEGIHVTVGYQRRNAQDTLFVGLGINAFGVGGWGAVQTTGNAQDSLGEAAAVTVRTAPSESLVRPTQQTVELAVQGDLREGHVGLLQAPLAISTTALQLDGLADKDEVGTVVLSMGPLKTGLATTDELRGSIARLKLAGKRVVARLRDADDKTYRVAAAASEVQMDPVATLRLDGFVSAQHFLPEALDKLRLRFDVVGIGKYKSGADALVRQEPRPEEVETQRALLAQAHSSLTAVLSGDRHLNPAQVHDVFDVGLLDPPAAQTHGLVDRLTCDPLRSEARTPLRRRQRGLPPHAFVRPSRRWGQTPAIAVVPVVGMIVGDATGSLPLQSVSAGTVVRALRRAAAAPHVLGVVLRVDSPGGDVVASEEIWRAVHDTRLRKPVVVSMGDVAASGGYYVAAGAQRIFAQTNTVTGSIGIFMFKPDVSGLLQWAGVRRHAFVSSPRADWDSAEHALSDADRLRVEHHLDYFYQAFVARVARGRNLALERAAAVAQGRVYTGSAAQAVGLVDEIGGLADAIRYLKSTLHLPPGAEVSIEVPRQAPRLVGMLSAFDAAQNKATGWPASVDALQQFSWLWDRPLALLYSQASQN